MFHDHSAACNNDGIQPSYCWRKDFILKHIDATEAQKSSVFLQFCGISGVSVTIPLTAINGKRSWFLPAPILSPF